MRKVSGRAGNRFTLGLRGNHVLKTARKRARRFRLHAVVGLLAATVGLTILGHSLVAASLENRGSLFAYLEAELTPASALLAVTASQGNTIASVDIVETAVATPSNAIAAVVASEVSYTPEAQVNNQPTPPAEILTDAGPAEDRPAAPPAEAVQLALLEPTTLDPRTSTNTSAQAQCRDDAAKALAKVVVRFDTASTKLRTADMDQITKVVGVLSQCPDVGLEVAGHTDTTGADAQNYNLSWERAEAVQKELIRAGVVESRAYPVGHGARRPAARLPAKPTETDYFFYKETSEADLKKYQAELEKSNSMNRRVEFVVR